MRNSICKTDHGRTALVEGLGEFPGTSLSMVVPESLWGMLRFENHWFNLVVLKLLHMSELPRGVVKRECWIPPPVTLEPENLHF